MSDTTSEHDDLSTTQEYAIAGAVILFFGILYWLFNYGVPGITLNTEGSQSGIALTADNNQAVPQQHTLSSQGQTASATDTPKQDSNNTTETTTGAAGDGSAETDGNKQQFATKQAGSGSDTQQLAQSSASATTPEDTSATESAETDDGAKPSATDTENKPNNTDSTTSAAAAGTADSQQNQAQIQSGCDTATASLKQRVISDPAVLKLREHLSNGKLEQTVLMDSMSFSEKSEQADIKDETQTLDLAALMVQNPDAKILIRGHTANEGDKAASKTLALARATSVGQKLVEACATAGNIIIMGMGDAEPLSEDNNQQNRGNNRRIDVAITQ